MTTRADFRDQHLRLLLADTTQWPDATLNAWIESAIHEYSRHCPRQQYDTIEVTVSGAREYDTAGLLVSNDQMYGITRVEYPYGEAPPRFLQRLAETSPDFYGNPYYDVRPRWVLVLGEDPAAGEEIKVWYLTNQLAPVSDASTITVPDRHLDALKLYCLWQAALALEMEEARSPDLTSVYLTMIGDSAGRLERSFRARMNDITRESSASGVTGSWRMDAKDRIY